MKMKSFEYAKEEPKFKMSILSDILWARITTKNYEIVWWCLPIAPFFICYSLIKKWNYNRLQWSEEKAKKVLDYCLPYYLDYSEEEDLYYIRLRWGMSNTYIVNGKKIPFSLRKWAYKFDYDIVEYLENTYEKEGYTRTVEKDYDDIVIYFKKK